MTIPLEHRLLADAKQWKQGKKPQRPLKNRPTGELKSDGIYERVRCERKLKTQGEALKLVGTELRIRTRETG